MRVIRRALGELPLLARSALLGAAVLGVLGGVVGLVIGLNVYAPTAWAATFEVGVPAAFLGATVGLAAGAVVQIVRSRSEH